MRPGRLITTPILAACLASAAGCITTRDHSASASRLFAEYRFPRTREALRESAYRQPLHENSLLALSQLGMAALADGDIEEATRTLRESYELIESAQINDPARSAASALLSDKNRVWKGEPGEQAMTMYAFGVASALVGNWEDARVGARAATRRLRDYTGTEPDNRYDTEFSAAYLLEAVADAVIGKESTARDLAVAADPRAAAVISAIESESFNTIVIVDAGLGPRKGAYGSNLEETGWRARQPAPDAPLVMWFDGQPVGASGPALDVNALVANHRNDPLAEERRARGALGDAAVVGGAVVIGSRQDSSTNALVGLGVIAAGLLAKAGAEADTRFNALLPASSSIAVLSLPPYRAPLVVELAGFPGSRVVLPDFTPGAPDNPSVVYLRLPDIHNTPDFLRSEYLAHPNNALPPRVGDFPWILGGNCVATPTQQTLDIYQAGGYLSGLSVEDLRRLYALEGIVIGAGPRDESQRADPDLYRHILEGGHALFTPAPGTLAYKRIMCTRHAPYTPRSPEAARLYQQYTQSSASSPITGEKP
ncbi:MAG: hypothetical protein H6812_00440 [Phycisphaeraceae bacterium]|nr:hypothetical protein [Phycisphaerales bacterium]MCB9841703.1 hypothetical protein [Phycisphaeraceae bacterium]